jgi:REP element-mobilizing transposase RayT
MQHTFPLFYFIDIAEKRGHNRHHSMQQLAFPLFQFLKTKTFGGSLLKGNPRHARPISIKRPMHVVLKSTHARGELSLLRKIHARAIDQLLFSLAKRFRIRVYRFANSGNHLHLIIRAHSRREFNDFVRSFSGLIARRILKTERGSPSLFQKFWDHRPFSRILEWGKDYLLACAYLRKNTLEALGFLSTKKSEHHGKPEHPE